MESKIRIVIADDHLVFIDGIKSLLAEFADIKVVGQAENGEQLIKQVEIHKPDIALTDIQMPVKDGIEAAKEIRKNYPSVKIIALTMLKETIFIKKMLAAGIDAYVLKTVDKQELLRVIRKVAGGEKDFSPEITNQVMNNFSDRTSAIKAPELLTKREKEILSLIAQGFTDKEIAERAFLSPLTVTTHRKNILSKLGLKNKVELTRFAIDNNLVN